MTVQSKNPHIIRSQKIEISFTNVEEAMGMQNLIAEVFNDRLYPQMEILFDEFADKDHLISIDQLEIDSGILKSKNWENEFVENTLHKLRAELLTLNSKRITHDNLDEKFFFFLQHGHLPWNGRNISISQFESQLVIQESFIAKLRKILQWNDLYLKRFLLQFSSSFINKIVEGILIYCPDLIGEVRDSQSNEGILRMFSAKKREGQNIKSFQGNKEIENEMKIEPEVDHLYINNAGLVILHPFLPGLFEILGLTDNEQWKNQEAQQAAALVTQFLITGSDEYPKFDMSLNKILCGIELAETLSSDLTIDETYKQECNDLLSETIDYWKVLRNTSIDGLRETFLQRNGKLTQVDKGWLLQVEQRAVDVLMGHLPWGIGPIKLPWMQDVLYTEWV